MPKQTLRLLDRLEPLGLDNHRFQQLHHLGKRAFVSNARRWCNKVSFFSSTTNETVRERLATVLAELGGAGGPQSPPSAEAWDRAIARAIARHPF